MRLELHDDEWLDALATRARTHIGDGPPAEAVEAQRRAARAHLLDARPSRARRWRIGLAAAAVTAMVFGGVWLVVRRTVDLPFSVGHRPGATGEWLEATNDAPLGVTFVNGGGFDLEPQSAARVAQATWHVVRVELHHGRLRAEVQPTPGREWAVAAGPFSVRVVGTRLRVDWQPATLVLAVTVDRGEVEVTGEGLAPRGVSVRAGQVLEVDGRQGTSRLGPEGGETRASEPGVEPRPSQPAREEMHPRSPESRRAGPLTWRQLAERGNFSEAYDAALASGAFSALDKLSAADLLQLANVARYHGDAEQARRALLRLRQRFSAAPEKAMAAFLLGKVAMDTKDDPIEAARWLESYRHEAPEGPLADEALGRLIEIYQRRGDVDAARQAARTYLEEFPRGASVDTARSVLR